MMFGGGKVFCDFDMTHRSVHGKYHVDNIRQTARSHDCGGNRMLFRDMSILTQYHNERTDLQRTQGHSTVQMEQHTKWCALLFCSLKHFFDRVKQCGELIGWYAGVHCDDDARTQLFGSDGFGVHTARVHVHTRIHLGLFTSASKNDSMQVTEPFFGRLHQIMTDRCSQCAIHSQHDTCPVCLESLNDQPFLCMPVCKHPIHISCALGAAQYDVRCPVCRTKDPLIETKQDRETRMFTQLEEYATQQENLVNQYQRRRTNIIRKNPSLQKMRNRMRENERHFSKLDKELDRTWSKLQRRMWMEHETILDIKRRRNKARTRYNVDRRKLDSRLVPLIGDAPEFLMRTA